MEISEATERLHGYLKKTNRRYSIERDRLIEAVYSLPECFALQDLLNHIRTNKNVHALSTLYRNLSILVDSGVLTEYRSPAGRPHYWRGNYAMLLVCARCGQVIPVEASEEQLQFEADAARSKGFALLVTHRVIRGLCPKCQEEVRKAN